MADDIDVTVGTGTTKTVAADDVGGKLHQRVKISQGADGSATDVSSAAPLQVTLANTGANATPVVVDLGSNNDVTITGDALTSLQLADDVVFADDAAFTLTSSKVSMCGAIRDDALSTLAAAEGDAVPLRVGSTGALHITGSVSNGGTFAVQATQAGTWTVDLGATDNAVLDAIAASLAGTLTVGLPTGAATAAKQPALGTAGTASADVISVQGITSMTPLRVIVDSGTITSVSAGSMAATQSGTWTVQPGNTANTTAWLVTGTGGTFPVTGTFWQATQPVSLASVPSHAVTNAGTFAVQPGVATTGGESSLSALSTAAVYTAEVKGSAGQIYGVEIFNKGAAAVYARLYNQTGAPGSGDAANIIWRGIVPGSTTGSGFVKGWPNGKICSTGIGIRVSGAIADNDTTVLAANEVTINVGYK